MKDIFSDIQKTAVTILVVVLFPAATWLITTTMKYSDFAHSAKRDYVTTMLAKGGLTFPASLFVSDREVREITSGDTAYIHKITSRRQMTGGDGIELIPITGPTFLAKLLIVQDPSRVHLATTYPWTSKGVELDKLVKQADAVGGINGGLYAQEQNTGRHPLGVAVCDGEVQYNDPNIHCLMLVGLDTQHKLRIIDLAHKRMTDVEQIIKTEGIRDAVTFPDDMKDESNWFVKILDGDFERKIDARSCCINPRTAIGQRADGALLLLVTDGRSAHAHIGATAYDILRVMKQYGAVTAANLDGGSSSSMYYAGKYEMTTSTFYYGTSSWNLPDAFVIDKTDK